jgi:hypothetical protein
MSSVPNMAINLKDLIVLIVLWVRFLYLALSPGAQPGQQVRKVEIVRYYF